MKSEQFVTVPAHELTALRAVVSAAMAFFDEPYDNGQWESRLLGAVREWQRIAANTNER